MKRRLQALAVLLIFGVAKLPMEAGFSRHLLQAKLLSPPVDLELREHLGQISFAATLGGLRSLIATITRMRGFVAWENVDWAKVDEMYSITVRLQPRFENYWDEASWHMAFNAASYYQSDEKMSLLLRDRLVDRHVARGLEIVQEGLQVLPDSPKLWLRLAEIQERKLDDHAKAADAYLKTHETSGYRIYFRLAGYQYAQTEDPALWQKGYDMLMDAYRKNERKPSVITHLKRLEQRLNIPQDQRIPDPIPQFPARQ